MRTPLRAAAACSVAILLVACGAEAPPTPVPARDFGDPGVVTGSGYEMRYAALQATLLPAEVIAPYGIPQRSDRLVVNVSVLAQRGDGLPAAVQAEVAGTWRALAGEPVPLEFRAITAGGSVSYVADAPLRDREPIVLELSATPDGSTLPLRTRLTRRFDVD
jgi:hypothetical protein